MREALEAWLRAAQSGCDDVAAARAAAEAVAGDPWAVIEQAGPLARARRAVAETDLGLTDTLRTVAVDSRHAVARVPRGAPFPLQDRRGQRGRGAFDTPRDLARRVVASGLRAAGGARLASDPACGVGALLVALREAGVREIRGTDLDPVAVEVARIADPLAEIREADGLEDARTVDLVVGNPPFVAPELQRRALRARLLERFPWLSGRFDLAVPFAAACMERAERAVSLVLPSGVALQPYGEPLRRRWLQRHRVVTLSGPEPFPGAGVEVIHIALAVGEGPSILPSGVPASEVLQLSTAALDSSLEPGDVALVEKIRRKSEEIGQHCLVDTGVVAHGPLGGKARLLRDAPGEGRVPFADARDFFAGRHQWLQWLPKEMHRPKSREMFEKPKIVVQRLRGRGAIRAAACRDGITVGHTCTVVQPRLDAVDLDGLVALIVHPLMDAVLRLERGQRLDLYPRDVASMPVPVRWWRGDERGLAAGWGLSDAEVERLHRRLES